MRISCASEFIEAAKKFCDWIESDPLPHVKDHAEARRLLAKLYSTALDLPFAEPDDFEVIELNESIHSRIAERLSSLPFSLYWIALNSDIRDEGIVACGELGDDICDIYTDVKEGLLTYPHSMPTAVWHWRFTFDTHWGHHAVSAIAALHEFDPHRANE